MRVYTVYVEAGVLFFSTLIIELVEILPTLCYVKYGKIHSEKTNTHRREEKVTQFFFIEFSGGTAVIRKKKW